MLATSDGARFLYGLERLGLIQGGEWAYELHDALGSVRQWTDASAAVVGMQAYGPYGEPLMGLGPALTAWGYTGEWQDRTGLVYVRARWYDPPLGRFAQADPFAGVLPRPATQHPYTYALNQPLGYRDPSGRLTDEQIQAYTDYNLDSELEDLKKGSPEVYLMLRALHPDDWVWVGDKYYKASLAGGRLTFTPLGHSGPAIEANALVGRRAFGIERPTPCLRNTFFWQQGVNPEQAYAERWLSTDTYRKVSAWGYFRHYTLPKAVGSGLVGAGVGLLVGPLAAPIGIAIGFVVGVAVEVTTDLIVVPAGRGESDEIWTYSYEGYVETIVIRGGEVIQHDWTPR